VDISNVSNDDGRRCANLIAFLTKGRWDLTGKDAEELVLVKRWVHDLAQTMARKLAPAAAPASSGGFRVKSAGPLPATKGRKKK